MATLPVGSLPQDLSNARNFFCKLKIGDLEVNPMLILSVAIREWVFDIIPRLELTLSDDGALFEIFNLKDQTVIDIELARNKDEDGRVAGTFVLDNWSVDSIVGQRQYIFTINAVLQVDNFFYPIKTRSFKNKTSIKVLEQIAEEGFLFSEVDAGLNATDSMTWMQVNITNFEMVKHVLKRGNISDDAILTFIDMDGNFRVSSIKKSCEQKDATIAKFNLRNTTDDVFADDKDKNTIWYNAYKMENIESIYNKNFGYGVNYNYYDLSKNVKSSSSTPYAPFTKFNYQGGDKVDSLNYGLLTSNVFKDYFKAQVNNKYFKAITFSQRLALAINSIYPIKLLEQVDVIVPSILKQGEQNAVYSGKYLVAGIVHSATHNGIFKKEISLHRNGYNKNTFGV